MKKTRKIIALVLALTFMFCFMAMSASAATTEIQPRGTCPQCINGYAEAVITRNVIDWDHPDFNHNCSNIGADHAHYNRYYTIETTCRNCGYFKETNLVTEYCPHA